MALAEHQPLLRDLEALADLEHDWNGYGADPIDEAIIGAARRFICALPHPLAELPRVVPMTRGRLQFEWHRHGRSLEIEFESPDRVHYLQWDQTQRLEEEDVVPAEDQSAVLALIDRCSADDSNG